MFWKLLLLIFSIQLTYTFAGLANSNRTSLVSDSIEEESSQQQQGALYGKWYRCQANSESGSEGIYLNIIKDSLIESRFFFQSNKCSGKSKLHFIQTGKISFSDQNQIKITLMPDKQNPTEKGSFFRGQKVNVNEVSVNVTYSLFKENNGLKLFLWPAGINIGIYNRVVE